MKKTLILIGAAVIMSAGVANAATATMSCADYGKKIEAELKTAKLTAADKKTADDTFKKAQGECTAKKDADAVKDYTSIEKLLKKS